MSLENARIDNLAYAQALAAELKAIACSGDEDAAYALRGLLANQRLAASGPEASRRSLISL